MKRNYIITFLAECLTLACGVMVYKMAAVLLGEEAFGAYAVGRRTLSFLQLPLLLGLGLSVPRYMAFAVGSDTETDRAEHYVAAGVLVLVPTLVGVLGGCLAWRETCAAVFFGDVRFTTLVPSVAVATAGVCLHALAYAYFRGRLRMTAANTLQVVNMGLWPLAVFAWPALNVRSLFYLLGAGWLLIGGGALVRACVRMPPVRWAELRRRAAVLLRYGVPRVPGELALTALLGLPVFWAAHTGGITEAGSLAFAVSLLNMVASLFAPLGLILLPDVSRMTANGTLTAFRPKLAAMTVVSVAVCGVLVGLMELFMPLLIRWMLTPEFLSAERLVRWVLVGAIPYTAYIVLRNVLDAVDVRPLNTLNLVASVVLLAGLSWEGMSAGVLGIAISLTIALSVLGGLTAITSYRLLRHWRPL